MTRNCIEAVDAATGNAFTEAEIDDLMNRVIDRAKKAKAAEPTLDDETAIRTAAAALTRDEIFDALKKRRVEVATEISTRNRRRALAALPDTMQPDQKLSAYDVGDERLGVGTRLSVDAEGRTRALMLLASVDLGLDQRPGLKNRLSNFWFKAEDGFGLKVLQEVARINGDGTVEPTGDDDALHAGQVIAKGLEAGRQMQNDGGAYIAKREGYFGRQTHDANKIAGGFWRELAEMKRKLPTEGAGALDWRAAEGDAAQRAFRRWRDVQMKLLDPKTFEGLNLDDAGVHWERAVLADTEAEMKSAIGRAKQARSSAEDGMHLAAAGVIDDAGSVAERVLYHAWVDIVTGRHEELSGMDDGAEFRPPASLAGQVSRSRFFIYRSPAAFAEYHGQFGRGNLLQGVFDQLDRAGRNSALLARWGPNPDMARAAEITRLSNEARGLKNSAAVIKRLNGSKLQSQFEAIAGRSNTPANVRMADIGRTIRAWEGLVKLGGITLSKTTDLFLCQGVMARAGAGFFHGFGDYFTGILGLGSQDAKEAARSLGVGARAFGGHIAGQYGGNDGARGWMAWGARMQYRLNLFEYVNEAVQRGIAQALSHFMGTQSEKAFDDLHLGTRQSLTQFGISPDEWEIARQGLEKASDGEKYFTMDHLERVSGGLTPADRSALQLKFLAFFHDQVENATAEPRAREKVSFLGGTAGTQDGTPWGLIARSISQFRGFTTAVLGRHLVPAARGYAGYSPVALVANIMVMSIATGYLAMNAKLIAKGQSPVSPLNPDGSPNLAVWGAALAQGAGLGIYGDFLLGEKNRNDIASPIASMAGPTLGDAERIAQVLVEATHGGAVSATTGRSAIPGQLVHIASSNIPVVNNFYTRLALDYLILWRLQEWTSPGYLQRYQSEVERQQGHSFIVPPTSAQ
jgi:hypothetical protein